MRIALAVVIVVALAGRVGAHMEVSPATSSAGGAERYTLVVPTEGRSATVRVELRIPMGMDVAAVETKPGWEASYEPFPIGRATVRWTGGRIPPGQMATFEFLAVNPPAARVLTWNATQWYEDGTSDRWGEGAPPEHHASTTTLTAAAEGDAHAHADSGHHDGVAHPDDAHHDAAPAADAGGHEPAATPSPSGAVARHEVSSSGWPAAFWLSVVALVVSAAALGVAIGARRRK